jgi:hypothetical protein
MVEDGITLTEEEYDDMMVEEHPKADDKEAHYQQSLFIASDNRKYQERSHKRY